ncbi:MAG: hypothetical protein QOH89_2708 [Pseudonocardiales bacterium]|nr:hypothetical protein [Pseudonocardiales bacterium]
MRWTARLTPLTSALAVSVVLCAVYLAWRPLSPDLSAQLARADLVERAGNISWWTGWFGGLTLPTYSLVTPQLMAWIGVAVTGAVATVAGCCGAALLMREALRPKAGAVVFSVFGVADLVAGRVTFTVGLAFAVWSLVALREHWRVASAGLAVLAYFSSPLAGLFLGLVLLAVVVTDRPRRASAAWAAGVLLACAVAMAVLFPGAGTMGFRVTDAIPPGAGFLAVAIAARQRVVRVAALLALAALPAFMIVPGAVGSNIARLAWVCAVPVFVGCATLRRRWLVLLAVALSVWPVSDIVQQVRWFPGRPAHAAYYEPLARELRSAQAAAGPAARGERLELLDPIDHSGSYFLARSFALARGWDRQVDRDANAIFYDSGALTAESYAGWLHDHAVGWVAVPATRLDYGSRTEADLVQSGVPALELIWTSSDWRLYRVRDATPLATGALVSAVGAGSVTLHAGTAGVVTVRVQWTPYLQVVDAATGDAAHGACLAQAGRWVELHVPAAGEYRLVNRFDPFDRFGSDGCS